MGHESYERRTTDVAVCVASLSLKYPSLKNTRMLQNTSTKYATKIILKSAINTHRHNAPSPTVKNKGHIKLQEQIYTNNYDNKSSTTYCLYTAQQFSY
jgi:hypothetical protein